MKLTLFNVVAFEYSAILLIGLLLFGFGGVIIFWIGLIERWASRKTINHGRICNSWFLEYEHQVDISVSYFRFLEYVHHIDTPNCSQYFQLISVRCVNSWSLILQEKYMQTEIIGIAFIIYCIFSSDVMQIRCCCFLTDRKFMHRIQKNNILSVVFVPNT